MTIQKLDFDENEKCPCMKTCCENPKVQGDENEMYCLYCHSFCLCNS